MKKSILLLPLTVAALLLSSCNNPADSDNSEKSKDSVNADNTEISQPETSNTPKTIPVFTYTPPVLPKNVGNNPFIGKSTGGDPRYSTEKYVFESDKYLTEYYSDGDTYYPQTKYEYSYNENTKLMSLKIIAITTKAESELMEISDYINREIPSELLENITEDDLTFAYYNLAYYESIQTWYVDVTDSDLIIQKDIYSEIPELADTKWYFIDDNHKSNYMYSYFSRNPFKSSTKHMGGILKIDSNYYTITDIVDYCIFAQENEEKNNSHETVNLKFEYKIGLNADGTLTLKLTGTDDVTKAILGATEEEPYPEHQFYTDGKERYYLYNPFEY